MKRCNLAAAVTLVAMSAVVGCAQASSTHHSRRSRCPHLACIASPGARLNIDQVRYWGPGVTDRSQSLIAIKLDVLDTTGPKNYPSTDPQYQHRGILDPNPDADAFNGSYYITDATGRVDAEYSNGCRYQSGDPSNPFLVYNLGPQRNHLLYPHQSERGVWLCFQVSDPSRRMRFEWYPNHQHDHVYAASIPGARRISGAPVPTN